MKKPIIFSTLGVLVVGAGLLTVGCKSAPELTKAKAQSLIQAEYDNRPAEPLTIAVNDMGLKQGINAKLWKLTKVYPNMRWADYTLTPEGKAAFKLQSGGDVIEWRPEQGNSDFHFFIITTKANHLKAKEVADPENDVVAGVDKAKGTSFTEVDNFEGIPDSVQTLAKNSINKITTRRRAEFELANGDWKLHSIN